MGSFVILVFHISTGAKRIAEAGPDKLSPSSSKFGGIDEERPAIELVGRAWLLINITGMAVNT